MACPFVHTIGKQHSVADSTTWNLEDDLTDLPDDALTLTHLNAAIQLLTAPSNENINQAVKSVIKKYSDRWPGIINLKIDSDSFSMYPNYDYLADIQDSIVGMDEAAASEILILIGEELIDTCCVGIIERAFRCLGGDLQEFLGSLDGVHDVLKLQEANISDTGFVCAGEGELIFTSERPVISWLLLGSLRQLAKILYGIEDAQITMEPIDGDVKRYRYLFDVGPSLGKRQLEEPIQLKARKRASVSTAAEDLKMNATTFCKAFPWHFVMNENLELLQLGHGFNRLFRQSLSLYGRHATTYFRFKRPRGLSLNFQEIRKHTHTPFLLAIRSQVCRRDSTMTGLEIKGQMVYCAETNTLLFIGSPFLDGLEGLTCNGLFISDIPLHDATREVILVGEQARAQDGLRRRIMTGPMESTGHTVCISNGLHFVHIEKTTELIKVPVETLEHIDDHDGCCSGANTRESYNIAEEHRDVWMRLGFNGITSPERLCNLCWEYQLQETHVLLTLFGYGSITLFD
uniref:guanylate cyclase n=1 Tax=Phlebotomus papatasi TaxID=29031 RepID=A0A1B0DMC0_PHLPP